MTLGTTLGTILNEAKKQSTSQIIREKLKKELGLSNRDVSVKTSRGGYESAVRVKVKSPKALKVLGKIEHIADDLEKVDYDERTGEILAGGNTFVFVDIDYDLEKKLREKIQDEFESVRDEFESGNNVKLFKTFDVNHTSTTPYVAVKKTMQPLRGGLDNVGSAILGLISIAKDDSLYGVIVK